MNKFYSRLLIFFLINALLVGMFPTSNAVILGDDTYGGGWALNNDCILFCGFVTPNYQSIAKGINVYMACGPLSFKSAIYDSDLNLLNDNVTSEEGTFASDGWYSLDINGTGLEANTGYYLACWANTDASHYMWYDTSGGNGVYRDSLVYYGSDHEFPDTLTIDSIIDDDGSLNIYCDIYPINFSTVSYTLENYDDLNISWTKPSDVDRVVIRSDVGSYPATPTDGMDKYNDTGLYYVDTDLQFNSYYTLWGYNSTYNIFSNATYSSFRGLKINVYNESNPSEELVYDVLFNNQSNSESYDSNNNPSPSYFDMDDIPTGENIDIYFNSTGYNPRLITLDLNASVWTNLTVYLSDVANLYYIRVLTEYELPIYQAEVEVTSFLNGSYQTIAKGITDGNGHFPVYLNSNYSYRVNISAFGFDSLINQVLNPDPTNYGIYYPIEYIMKYHVIDFKNEPSFKETITFTGELNNDVLYINYTDISGNTTDTYFNIIEINGSTNVYSFFNSASNTNENNIRLMYDANDSNCYFVTLYVNHTDFGFFVLDLVICNSSITSKTVFNSLFDANYGSNPFGWANTLGFFFLVAMLFGFGQVNSGVGLMLTGFILLFVNGIIGLAVIGVLVPTLFILLGILVIWATHRRVY